MIKKIFTPLDEGYAMFNPETNSGNILLVDTYNRYLQKVKSDESVLDKLKLLKKKKGLFRKKNEMKRFCLDYNVLDVVYYNITYQCNQRCKYCYSPSSNREFVSLNNNKKIISSLKKLNTKCLVLLGGEPFCHPKLNDILESILKTEYFKEVRVITNGTLMNDSVIEYLVRNNVYIQISLDGYSDVTNGITRTPGSFERIYKNIIKLKKANANIKVMQTITNENISHAIDFYRHFKKIDVPAGFFMVKNNNNKKVTKASVDKILRLINELYLEENENIVKVFDVLKIADNIHFNKVGFPSVHCGAGINSISIDPFGNIFPCVKMSYEKHKMGNMVDRKELARFIDLRKKKTFLPLVDNIKKCQNCEIKYFCGGGCRAEHATCVDCFDDSGCAYYKNILFEYLSKVMEVRC